MNGLPHTRSFGPYLGQPALTPAVKWLLIANTAAFVLQTVGDRLAGGTLHDASFTSVFSLSMYGLSYGRIWQPFTYMFLHGGPLHLLFNMLALFFFGRTMEDDLGTRRFLWLYLVCGVVAGLGWLLLSGFGSAPCVGASGAILGVMGAMAALHPHRQVTLLVLLVLPVTMTMRTLILIIAGVSLLMLVSSDGHIAHAAHLFGGLTGYIYGIRRLRGLTVNPVEWWRERRAARRRARFRLVEPEEDPGPVTAEQVDAVLDKLREHGMSSLSKRERAILEKASHGMD